MEIHRLNALDAENAVAGSILIAPRAFAIASDILDSFQSELCRCIFRAAQSLSMAGQPIDPVAISKHLRETGTQIDNGTLCELMDITPTATFNFPFSIFNSNAVSAR